MERGLGLVVAGARGLEGLVQTGCACVASSGRVKCMREGPSPGLGLHTRELANEPRGRQAAVALGPGLVG